MTKYALTLLVLCCSVGCSSGPATNLAPPAPGPTSGAPTAVTRKYTASASVGDFMLISVDSAAGTISYTNRSNGESGTATYTVNSDGGYALKDPSGNLIAAYEIPGYALIVEAAKSGADRNTPALITAVESGSVSLSRLSAHGYNYMQFRTAAGGFETGSVDISAAGVLTQSTYWPYGEQNNGEGNSPFLNGTRPLAGVQEDPTGTFLRANDDGAGTYDYIFGTQSGIFVVDTPNGSIFGFAKAATKDFDASSAGTYRALRYQKIGARTGLGNVETGTPSLSKATFVLGSDGTLTMRDASGALVDSGTLEPVADVPYLYGSGGGLHDPCFGLFTYRSKTETKQTDVFVTFIGRAMLFSSFGTALPLVGSNAYDYDYGVALKS